MALSALWKMVVGSRIRQLRQPALLLQYLSFFRVSQTHCRMFLRWHCENRHAELQSGDLIIALGVDYLLVFQLAYIPLCCLFLAA